MRRLLLLALLAVAAGRPVPVANALPASGPPLSVPRAALAASFSCHGDVRHAAATPVVLIHGTGSTPSETWGPVYEGLLDRSGIPRCEVALPERATTDLQVSVEYVVHGIRAAYALRGGRVDVLGHSQGATLPVYALKYWPDLAGEVEDLVALAPTLGQGVSGEVQCQVPCTAPFQQRRAGSVFFQQVSAHPLPPEAGRASITTIATLTDEIATPEPAASHLDGATNIVLQDVCPAKVVDHFGLVADGTVAALVLDGLQHDGPVDPARLPSDACTRTFPPGTDPVAAAPLIAAAVANDLQANGNATKLSAEPPVRCWVRSSCADPDQRGRLLTSARLEGRLLTLTAQAPGTLHLAGRTVALRVGRQSVTLASVPASALALRTSTSWYTTAATELTLPGRSVAAAPGPALPTTGSGPALTVAALLLLSGAGLLRRPASGTARAAPAPSGGVPPRPRSRGSRRWR